MQKSITTTRSGSSIFVNLFVCCTMVCLFVSNVASGQQPVRSTAYQLSQHPSNDLEQFFKKIGIKDLTNAAHPFMTGRSHAMNMNDNTIFLTIYYEEGAMDLKIRREGKYFKRLTVTRDVTGGIPFFWLEVLKGAISELDGKDDYVSFFEVLFGKPFSEMSGEEFMCIYLSIRWNLG